MATESTYLRIHAIRRCAYLVPAGANFSIGYDLFLNKTFRIPAEFITTPGRTDRARQQGKTKDILVLSFFWLATHFDYGQPIFWSTALA